MTRSDAGKLGGQATRDKYGLEFYRINGTRGGRPRAKTLQQQPAPNILENKNGGKATRSPLSLKTLRELWKVKRGECCN